MNGREFTRRARRYARRTGQSFYLDTRQGKGSHSKLRIGKLKTTVQHGEIRKGLLMKMLKDLGIDRENF